MISEGRALDFSTIYNDLQLPLLIGKSIDADSQKILMAGFLAQGLAQTQDATMRSQWLAHQRMSESTARAGDYIGMGALSAPILLGQYLYDYPGLISHLRGFISVGSVTISLKYIVGRRRPGTSPSLQSFPSGHTSTAFMSATVLSYSYGYRVGLVAYPLACLVGLSRMADDAHWFSDVVAGAFLGLWAGRASSFESPRGPTVLPWTTGETNGLIVMSHF